MKQSYTLYRHDGQLYVAECGVSCLGQVLLRREAHAPRRVLADYIDSTLPIWAGHLIHIEPAGAPGLWRIEYELTGMDHAPYPWEDPVPWLWESGEGGLFAFLVGKPYVLDGVHGVFSVDYVGARPRLYHRPSEQGRKSSAYRTNKRELGDDYDTDVSDSEQLVKIAVELGYLLDAQP